jgi:alpha-tubulin suppressor-like RCC1 family protein
MRDNHGQSSLLLGDRLARGWHATHSSRATGGGSGGHQFRQVSAGGAHTCGVTTDNQAYCWGRNYSGQLGDGTTSDRQVPVLVAGGRRFRQVSAASSHTCGIGYSDRQVYCWGSNYRGMLGDGTTTPRLQPVAVLGDRQFRHVSGGSHHTCGVTTDNRAYC